MKTAFAYGLCWLALNILAAAADVEGLPITRTYPLEEVGNISRGGQLSYDRFGRLAVIQDGAYIVLNDNSWNDLGSTSETGIKILQATCDSEGTTYFGALGNWGKLTSGKSGEALPQSLRPKNSPDWVSVTNFSEILVASETVYFAGWNGIAAWNPTTGTQRFIPVPEVAAIFQLGETVYVSSHVRGLMKVPASGQTVEPADMEGSAPNLVMTHCARFGSGKALLSSSTRRLYLWDNKRLTPFLSSIQNDTPGVITALQPLAEGDVAVAILNAGVFIVNESGQVRLALNGPNYRHVTALAAKEPGVLWAMTENDVQKIFYKSPITVFGQSLGITVEWPQIVSWNDEILVASGGHLYAAQAGGTGEPSRFARLVDEPLPGTWGIGTFGPWLITGNQRGVFSRLPGEGFTPVLPGINAARIAITEAGICYVIGSEEIAVLRNNNGQWEECAQRIRGVGFPSIIHTAMNSVWIELGADRAARVSLRSGKLEARVFDSFPWAEPHWVNISVLGPTVVLTGTDNKRLYYDETTEAFIDAGQVKNIIAQCPLPPYRLAQDSRGTIWASMAHGITTFTAQDQGFLEDAISYELVTERIPIVQTLPQNDIWISTGTSLYHVNPKAYPIKPANFRPIVVSIRDSRTNAEMLTEGTNIQVPFRYSAKQNSFSITFFSNSYRYRVPPRYEYRLNEGPWTSLNQSPTLTLSDLHEGEYNLDVRLIGHRGVIGTAANIAFSVDPPWYRTWYAYILYPLLAAAVLYGISLYSMKRAKARSKALEKLVADRTTELTATMEKLHKETLTSAMLAERARLANEIHDSLEQGFTGLQLQLETTANFPNCSPEIRSSLGVAVSMVAYSRNEVRHAVRNLHAPILDSADLTTAVRHIIALLSPDPQFAILTVKGTPRRLDLTVEHHLLRMAQEALTNALKHASATNIAITIDFRDQEVELSVRDNGCGFDPSAAMRSETGHFGLPSFRGRASTISGTVEIKSAPGSGTVITVRVPLLSTPA
ncbi:MAG: sensor histidine kinase [Nibricoccus sp.]